MYVCTHVGIVAMGSPVCVGALPGELRPPPWSW